MTPAFIDREISAVSAEIEKWKTLKKLRKELNGLQPKKAEPELENIILASCQVFRVSREDVMGRARARDIADARQVAMVYIKAKTGLTLQSVGDYFGKDHGTVLHACRAVRDKCYGGAFMARYESVGKLINETRAADYQI